MGKKINKDRRFWNQARQYIGKSADNELKRLERQYKKHRSRNETRNT